MRVGTRKQDVCLFFFFRPSLYSPVHSLVRASHVYAIAYRSPCEQRHRDRDLVVVFMRAVQNVKEIRNKRWTPYDCIALRSIASHPIASHPIASHPRVQFPTED